MSRMSLAVALGFALALAACNRKPEAKHPYAGFKLGAFAKYRTVTDMGAVTLEGESQTTILEITEEHVLIETESKLPNMDPRREKAKLSLSEIPKRATPRAHGTEEITVPGGTFKCTWTEVESEQGEGRKAVTREWLCEEVPSHVVKEVTTTPSTTITKELVAFALEAEKKGPP
jgi:hypothetical protein